MRILLLSAGSSVHTARWARAFAAKGCEVHLITQHPPQEDLGKGITVHVLPHLKGAGYLLNGGRVARLVEQIKPDVVNAHYATGYGTLARAVRGVPVVLNVWGSDVYDFPEKSFLHRWWLHRNLRSAQLLVSTSEVMADRTRHWVPDRPRPTVVPFGVETDRFSPRSSTGGRSKEVVVGTVKTLAHKYGIDTLISAFALLTKRAGAVQVKLRIVGGGPAREELQRMVAGLGLAGQVEFTGPVPHEQVPEELRKLAVFVALSREDSESFGVAVIEASACGLPVVVSDAGGLPEVVLNGSTGGVVPRNDPAAAAEQLARLVSSSDLREQWGRAGRAHVMKHYEWSACVDRMMDVLQQAINEHHRA